MSTNLHPGLVYARTIAMVIQTTGMSIAKRFEQEGRQVQATDKLKGEAQVMAASSYGTGFSEACRFLIQAIDAKLDDLIHERKHHDEPRKNRDEPSGS